MVLVLEVVGEGEVVGAVVGAVGAADLIGDVVKRNGID